MCSLVALGLLLEGVITRYSSMLPVFILYTFTFVMLFSCLFYYSFCEEAILLAELSGTRIVWNLKNPSF